MLDTNTTLLLIAALNAGTAYFAWRTNKTAADTNKTAIETRDLSLKTEVNTNSMREQLVAATGKAAHAEGKEEGRVEGEVKAEKVLVQTKLDAKGP